MEDYIPVMVFDHLALIPSLIDTQQHDYTHLVNQYYMLVTEVLQ